MASGPGMDGKRTSRAPVGSGPAAAPSGPPGKALEVLRAELASLGADSDSLVPRAFRAPGRVNLIGDHTDYNGGLVLPAAIDLAVYLLCVPAYNVLLRSTSEPGVVRLRPDGQEISGEGTPEQEEGLPSWGLYVQGVLRELAAEGCRLEGFLGVVASDIPEGRGLSSSAALEVAVATASTAISDCRLEPWTVAEACRRGEETYAGVRCGIMDQAVSLMGKAGSACLIDTAERSLRHVPIPDAIEMVVIDSGVRRDLSDGQYNSRRQECSDALDALKTAPEFANLETLSDLRPNDLPRCTKLLPPALLRRVRHVVTENQRVEKVAGLLAEAVSASKDGSLPPELAGELRSQVEESHRSLVEDYEAGHPVTDRIVELARGQEGYIGARQTGAGWGGSVVVFCHRGTAARLATGVLEVLDHPEGRAETASPSPGTGRTGPSYHVCRISDGACEIALPQSP